MPHHCIVITLWRGVVLSRSVICSVQGQSPASLNAPISHLLHAVIMRTVVYDVQVSPYWYSQYRKTLSFSRELSRVINFRDQVSAAKIKYAKFCCPRIIRVPNFHLVENGLPDRSAWWETGRISLLSCLSIHYRPTPWYEQRARVRNLARKLIDAACHPSPQTQRSGLLCCLSHSNTLNFH